MHSASVKALHELRTESAGLRGIAPAPKDRMSEIAAAAWTRADELADGVIRAASDPALRTCCGVLARALWEDAITLEYVYQSPDTRIDQLVAGTVDLALRLRRSQWGRERNLSEVPLEHGDFLAQRRQAETLAKERGTLRLDDYAMLPSVKKRSEAVNAHDQYEVAYALESARATHFGLDGLYADFVVSPEVRLLQSLTLTAGAYRIILALALTCLGQAAEAERLLAPLRTGKPARLAGPTLASKDKDGLVRE